MVLGGGIGGMQASLDLAYAGIKAYVVESKPSIGGVMAQLDKTFPTNDCAMCTMAPRLVELSRHKDIEIITLSEVENLYGEPGNFTVILKRRPRFVDEQKCTGCGSCLSVCPLGKVKPSSDGKQKLQPIPDEHNQGLSFRPAIYIPYPQAVPNKAAIDSRYCLHFLTGKCGLCKKSCKAGAIDFEQKEQIITLNVGAVIVTTGYELLDPRLKPDYGYGSFANVITALEFERILSASGPFQGKVLRPSDKSTPKRIAFIQCVGSRDYDRDYCSAVCCMYATKEAIIAKEHAGQDLQCDVFFMDVRAYGKGFEEYYLRAKKLGVNYIRCRPSAIKEIPETKNLTIQYLSEDSRKLSREYDLVVLSVGLQPAARAKETTERLGVRTGKYGFCANDSLFAPVNSSREGIFVAGVATEPKDIPEAVTQSSGAVAKVLQILADVKNQLIARKELPPEIDVSGQEPRVGVFVCHCGTNIAGVVNVPEVVEYAKKLPNVVYAENNLYACSNDTQERIKKIILEQKLNRVVVASCTPRTHEALFRNTVREAGLNGYLFEMANIRDQCSWVHMHEPAKATRKAKDLVRMAVAKARLLEPLHKKLLPVKRAALVIGGGISGMTAALELAEQGFPVHIVEKANQLGGNAQRLYYLLSGESVQVYLDRLIEKVSDHPKITVHTHTNIVSIEGSVGDFKTTIEPLDNPLRRELIEHGAIIVATGARDHTPSEYLYGKDDRVLTQLELEKWLATAAVRIPDTVVMIQCVESRDHKRPYCSRICCGHAVKNALRIKEISPDTSVFVLYKDIRTYGLKESYYTKARTEGVVFIRYDEDNKPEVSVKADGGLVVRCFDPVSQVRLAIDAGLIALSVPIVPNRANKELAQMLKVPLDQNGFFLEAHMKLRPVDFATDGIFVCGLAHYPKSIEESIAQACAAAARASTILSRDAIELEATISQVADENCDGCAYCVDPCPYKALTLIEYMRDGSIKKTVEVDESKCKGCGTCQATCPKKGIYVKGFRLEQIAAMVEAALEPVSVE